MTSPTGAVLHDIKKIAAERNPYVEIRLIPIPVQGKGVETKIAAAIDKAGTDTSLDVIVLARGGGSMEDLWCFNSPEVVKAIYHASVPVITAIGHETDTTLADYAADIRAATPTHAAEIAFFDIEEVEMELADLTNQAYEALQLRLERLATQLSQTRSRLQPQRYDEQIAIKETALSQLCRQGEHLFRVKLLKEEGRLKALKGALSSLDPMTVTAKGYGQLEQDGKRILAANMVDSHTPLYIHMIDGSIITEVKEVKLHGSDKRKIKKFEENMAKLEDMVNALEAPDLTLQESLDLYEKAIKLAQSCESALEYARQRAQVLADVQHPGQGDESLEEGTLDL